MTLFEMLKKLKNHLFSDVHVALRDFPGGSAVKNPPANAGETGPIPGYQNPLQGEMATHSSVLVWEIPWSEDPDGLQSIRSQKRQP